MNFVVPGSSEYPVKAEFDFMVQDNLSETADLKVEVIDDEGNTVVSLADENYAETGTMVSLEWDGNGIYGNPASCGAYSMKFTVADEVGNENINASSGVYLDYCAPGIEMVEPAPGEDTLDETPEVRLLVDDPGAGVDDSAISVTLDGADVSPVSWSSGTGVLSFTPTLTGNGHSLVVGVSDMYGNRATNTWTVNVDLEGIHTVAIETPDDGGYVGGDNVSVVVNAVHNMGAENFSTVSVYVDGGSGDTLVGSNTGDPSWTNWSMFVWDTTVETATDTPEFPDGTYTMRAVATDTLGRWKQATISVIVDNLAPVIGVVTVDPSATAATPTGFVTNGNGDVNTVSLTPAVTEANPYLWNVEIWDGDKTATDTALVYVSDDFAVASGGAPIAFAWDGNASDSADVDDGTYYYYLVARDEAGNGSFASQGQLIVDSQAPQLSASKPYLSQDGGDIALEASATDTVLGIDRVVFEYKRTGAAVYSEIEVTESAGSYVGTWSTGDGDNGGYLWRFTAYDKAGNATSTAETAMKIINAASSISNVSDTYDPFTITGNGDKTVNSVSFDVDMGYAEDFDWDVEISDASSTVLMTYSGFVTAASETHHAIASGTWQGEISGGGTATEGIYSYEITVTPDATGSEQAGEWTGGAIRIDNTIPTTTNPAAVPSDFFSPDGNGTDDTVQLSVTVTEAYSFETELVIMCGSSNSACISEYGTDTVLFALPDSYATGVTDTEISYGWNGMASDSQTVPDGDYEFTYSITDEAGNYATASAALKKYNPPVISLADSTIAFSPDDNGVQDTAEIGWSTDKDGTFRFDLCSEPIDASCYATLTTNVTSTGTAMIQEYEGGDFGGTEGVYYVRISGYGEVEVEPDVFEQNESAAAWVEVALDVTAPEVQAYFPVEDQFTSLKPRIKFNVTETLSGFESGIQSDSELTIDFVEYDLNVTELGAMSYRLWADVETALSEGPKYLNVTVTDRAGNNGELDNMRFVSISPLADEFATGPLDVEDNWSEMAPDYGTFTYEVDSGTLSLEYEFDGDELPGGDYDGEHHYAGLFFQSSLEDVSRKRVIAETEITGLSGVGDHHLTGIYFGGFSEVDRWGEYIPGVNTDYQAQFSVTSDYSGNPGRITVVYGAMPIDYDAPLFDIHYTSRTPASLPADPMKLKVVYDEGTVEYYLDGELLGSDNITFDYLYSAYLVGAGADEGFGSTVDCSADIEYFRTNLVQLKLDNLALTNLDTADPNAREIYVNDERYNISVEGTRWQKDVKAYLVNYGNPGFPGDYSDHGLLYTDGAVVDGPFDMVETGTGTYTMDSGLLLNYTDNKGYEAETVIPVVSTDNFVVANWPSSNYDILIPSGGAELASMSLSIRTDAVQDLAITNLDGPEGYDYIVASETYRVTAVTKPGDWDIDVYILNLTALSGGGLGFMDTVIEGPFAMKKVSDGLYSFEAALGGIVDVLGSTAQQIVPLAVFGPNEDESFLTDDPEETLSIGSPYIRAVTVSNADRPGAEDIITGETATITAVADTGLSVMSALMNPDNPGGYEIVGVPKLMTESLDNPGSYFATIPLRFLIDDSGYPVSEILGFTMTPFPEASDTIYVTSDDTLTAFQGDLIPPKKPADALVTAGLETIPLSGEQVSTTLTWSAPTLNEDETILEDLAGYNIYRAALSEGASSLAVASGTNPLSVTLLASGTYSINNTILDYDGVTYDSNVYLEGAAGWFSSESILLTQFPLSDSDLVEPEKPIYAYVADISFTGFLFGEGDWEGTIYSQERKESLDNWVEELVDVGMAATGSSIIAWTIAFEPDTGNEFSVAADLDALDSCELAKANEEVVTDTLYTDSYEYSGSVYSYVVRAVDNSGNESLLSDIASMEISSGAASDTNLVDNYSGLQNGYIRIGEEYSSENIIDAGDDSSVELMLVNSAGIASAAPLDDTIVEGPFVLSSGGASGTEYTRYATLSAIVDAAGKTAPEITAILKLDRLYPETITSADALKTGAASVETIQISNAGRPDKTSIRIGETIKIAVNGAPGLDLSAALTNPGNTSAGGPADIDQPAFSLEEKPAGSGHYQGAAEIMTNTDTASATAILVSARIYDDAAEVAPRVYSDQSLDLLALPAVAGNLTMDDTWIKTGWNTSSSFSITNNEDEALTGVTISVSLLSTDGSTVHMLTATDTISASGGTATGSFAHPATYLGAGSYDLNLDIVIDDYVFNVATAGITITNDAIAGAVTTDKPSYITGQTAQIACEGENVSGYTLDSVTTEILLADGAGAAFATQTGPASGSMQINGTISGNYNIDLPSGLATDTLYTFSFSADIDGRPDPIAEKNILLYSEKVLVSGFVSPETIVQFQEPLFEFQVYNRTLSAISDTTVSGVIVPAGWQTGEPVISTFEKEIANLGAEEKATLSATFAPVDANPGEYDVIIYIKESPAAPTEQAMQTTITVESCEVN